MDFSRRNLLKSASVLGAQAMLPMNLLRLFGAAIPDGFTFNGKHLVLIELFGGNDGLNTLIPVTDQHYYNRRPNIAIHRRQNIAATTGLANLIKAAGTPLCFHPSLPTLHSMYLAQELACIYRVGHDKMSRSHFTDSERWNTASDGYTTYTNGWVDEAVRQADTDLDDGDVLAHGALFSRPGAHPLRSSDLAHPATIRVATTNALTLAADAAKFPQWKKRGGLVSPFATDNTAGSVLWNTYRTIDSIAQSPVVPELPSAALALAGVDYSSDVVKDVVNAARVIRAGLKIPVLKCSLGGFDTHANQGTIGVKEAHAKQLGQVNDAMQVIKAALTTEQWKNTLVMIYSEFGRIIDENPSRGTDHGQGNVVFFAGGGLTSKGGGTVISPHFAEMKQLQEKRNATPVILSDGTVVESGAALGWDVDVRRCQATALDWLGWWKPALLQTAGSRFFGHDPVIQFTQ